MVVLRCSIVILLTLVCPNQCSFSVKVTDNLTTEVVHSQTDATKAQLHNSVGEYESSDDYSSNDHHKNGTNGTNYGDNDDEVKNNILSIATVTILTLLVVLSIIFEKLKEYALEETSKFVVPVVQSVFGELTVLGFIGLIIFIIDFKVHVGADSLLEFLVVSTLHQDMSEELSHLAEILHMSVFLVMILFLGQVGILLAVASGLGKKWTQFEHQRDRVEQVAKDYQQAKASGNCMCSRSKQLREELEYHALRQGFTHPRVGDVFDQCSAPRPLANVDHDFDFADYLSQGLSLTLCNMVDVGLLGWLALWVLTVVFWSFHYVDGLIEHHVGKCPVITTWVLAVSGYLFPMMLACVSCKLAAAKKQLLPPRYLLFLQQDGDMERPLLGIPQSDSENEDNLDVPSYLYLSPAKPFGCRCCCKHKGTRHDNLFWFGPLGVEFLRLFFSAVLLLCSSYWGACAGLFSMIANADCDVHLASKILLVCVMIPPPIIVWMCFVNVMGEFVLTSFVEEKRDRNKIKDVLLSMKTRKVYRMLKLINAMHNACMRNSMDWFLQVKQENQDDEELVAIPLRITRCRRGFKPIPGRHLDWSHLCEDSASHLQRDLESGELKLPHVPVFVRSKRLSEKEGRDVYFSFEQAARLASRTTEQEFQLQEAMEAYSSIFDAIDRDGSGAIVHGELANLMKELGFNRITARFIDKLIARLDVDGNGVIDKSEFLKFFRKKMCLQSQESTHQVVHNIFRYFDTDHSGAISTTEFVDVISKLDNGSLTRQDVEEIVRMADKNGDGEICLHELTHLIDDSTKGQIV